MPENARKIEVTVADVDSEPLLTQTTSTMGDVKNIKTRVAWSLKKERASLVVENFKEAMDHLGSVNVISSAAFLVRN